jgi:quinol monooxygenase YgiN
MIIELVGIVASPNNRAELGRALFSLLGQIRAEPGCKSCLLYQDWSDANVLYIESRWETLSDLKHHIRSEKYKWLLLLIELGVERPAIEFLTVTEVKGLDFIEATREVSNLSLSSDSDLGHGDIH